MAKSQTVQKQKPQSAKQAAQQINKQAQAQQQSAKPQETKQEEKKVSLFFFQQTPGGRLLRAYFIAFITAQTGKLAVGAKFKLWPHCNIRGHLATGKIERKEAGYALTTQGYNYFTSPEQEADKELLAKFTAAIKSGNKPDCYKFQMQPMK